MVVYSKRIKEYEKIIYLTHYRMYDLTNRWARIGVQSQAMTDSVHPKHRVAYLWSRRHGDGLVSVENRGKILMTIKYLRKLKVICNAEADRGGY